MSQNIRLLACMIVVCLCAGTSAACALQPEQRLSSLRTELLQDGWQPAKTDLKMADGTLWHDYGKQGFWMRLAFPK